MLPTHRCQAVTPELEAHCTAGGPVAREQDPKCKGAPTHATLRLIHATLALALDIYFQGMMHFWCEVSVSPCPSATPVFAAAAAYEGQYSSSYLTPFVAIAEAIRHEFGFVNYQVRLATIYNVCERGNVDSRCIPRTLMEIASGTWMRGEGLISQLRWWQPACLPACLPAHVEPTWGLPLGAGGGDDVWPGCGGGAGQRRLEQREPSGC